MALHKAPTVAARPGKTRLGSKAAHFDHVSGACREDANLAALGSRKQKHGARMQVCTRQATGALHPQQNGSCGARCRLRIKRHSPWTRCDRSMPHTEHAQLGSLYGEAK